MIHHSTGTILGSVNYKIPQSVEFSSSNICKGNGFIVEGKLTDMHFLNIETDQKTGLFDIQFNSIQFNTKQNKTKQNNHHEENEIK